MYKWHTFAENMKTDFFSWKKFIKTTYVYFNIKPSKADFFIENQVLQMRTTEPYTILV